MLLREPSTAVVFRVFPSLKNVVASYVCMCVFRKFCRVGVSMAFYHITSIKVHFVSAHIVYTNRFCGVFEERGTHTCNDAPLDVVVAVGLSCCYREDGWVWTLVLRQQL